MDSTTTLELELSNSIDLIQQEILILKLASIYSIQSNINQLTSLITKSHSILQAKAKTAKLIKSLLDLLQKIPNSTSAQITIIQQEISYAKENQQVFLKQHLETRLIELFIQTKQFKQSNDLITTLLKELKRLDDKMILTQVHLLESITNQSLQNYPKAKAALVSARTAANSIYCPPTLQANLDLQSGVLHAQDKDYKTAYSYFFEALEGLASQDDPKAADALKYMLLCKIMLNLPEDVSSIISGKLGARYPGTNIDALKEVAKAHEERNLANFETTLRKFKSELSDDPIVKSHLAALYDTLLEQNLVRIIEPYSKIELTHLAELVKQPVREVEGKLSQMILDKVLRGVLDQEKGCLIVFEEDEEDKTYGATLETIGHISQIVDHLFIAAAKLR